MPDGEIPLSRPWMDEREADAARRPILSGWVTQGPEVAAFELEFAAEVGALHACAVSNCTTALHIALLAVGVRPGDEVITVSHSYIATANAIRYCGATPVFVDIESGSFNMDANLIEGAVTARTRAILCVHQLGMPCDLASIVPLARRHNVPLIEDAACATGSRILWNGRWEHIGKPHGDIACFSFHPRKVVTTGDGGMLTTANAEWDRKFRLWRQHSMDIPDTVRHHARQVVFESYPEMGFNYRMTDIQAAVGREQLKRLPQIVERRRDLASAYGNLLALHPGIGLPLEPEWACSNWQSYCVRLPDSVIQRSVMQFLLDRGIHTRRGIMNSHREPAYADGTASRNGSPLPESERAQHNCLILPLFHQMTEGDQSRVAQCLIDAVQHPACQLGVQLAE
ncbi:MAG: glutamine--scyllo-inositol transaminase [Bryobacterales bacterium]|nr:glutamine--scyllo-inositol transaminase [Bryobacterales bacterium]